MENNPEKISTRQKILENAIHLFAIKGYTETTIRELAAAVGVKEGSLYNHFPSKNAILERILEEYAQISSNLFVESKLDTLQDTLKNNPTANSILSCLRLSFPAGKEKYYIKQLCVILQEQYRNPLVRKFMTEEYLMGTENASRTVIDKLKELNVLRQDTNTDYWAKTHSSLMYAFSSRMLLGIGDQSPDFSGMGLRELLWNMYDSMLKTCGIENKKEWHA